MKEQYLEVGKITNVHGVMGEVRVQPWADSPDFLCKFKTLYVDSSHWPIKVERARVHKNMVILKLEGVTDVPSALAMRNAVLYIDRADVKLPEGSFFLADIMDLNAVEKVQASFFPSAGQDRRHYGPARRKRVCHPGGRAGDHGPCRAPVYRGDQRGGRLYPGEHDGGAVSQNRRSA